MRAVFHHGDAGTDESVWQRHARHHPVVHFADLSMPERAVVVAPHPDDESLGAGGIVASWSAAGVAVTVVVCSDGEAVTGSAAAPGPDAVRTRRIDEVVAACETLSTGVPITLVLLGFPDGALSAHEKELQERLLPLIAEADIVVSPWPGDGHPDHEAVGNALRAVASTTPRLEYPIWAWHWGTPEDLDDGTLIRVPLSPSARRTKTAAIDCHASQTGGDDPVLTSSVRTHFDRAEELFVVDGHTLAGLTSVPRSSSAFFDGMYRAAPSGDPWDFGSAPSELDRIGEVVASLGAAEFVRTIEVGCATGQMTRLLARRSARVLAVDTSARAIEVARAACEDLVGVELRVAHLPQDLTDDDRDFDLVVLSDVGYYFAPDDLSDLVELLRARCAPGATLLASHWAGSSPDHQLDAATTHRVIAETLDARPVATNPLPTHLVDLWTLP